LHLPHRTNLRQVYSNKKPDWSIFRPSTTLLAHSAFSCWNHTLNCNLNMKKTLRLWQLNHNNSWKWYINQQIEGLTSLSCSLIAKAIAGCIAEEAFYSLVFWFFKNVCVLVSVKKKARERNKIRWWKKTYNSYIRTTNCF